MSRNALEFSTIEALGKTDRLLTFYDFSGMSGRHIGVESITSSVNYGVIENCDPALNTGIYSGIVVGVGATLADAKVYTTGTFLKEDKADLNLSNVKVETPNLLYSEASVLFDFEFNDIITDCILFGSLNKTSEAINSEVVSGAKGYNFGINDRGKLFYQGFDKGGDFIYTANSIELSRRNIVGFSLGNNSLSLTRIDLLNNTTDSEDFSLDTNFISNSSEFYLGGSNEYFRTGPDGASGEYVTSRVNLKSFALFSGFLPQSSMFTISSGLIGDYLDSSSSDISSRRITGYNQTTTFKTGITGYDYENTGDVSISMGRYMLSGGFSFDTNTNKGEGDRYFEYNAFIESGIKTYSKQEVGFLKHDSGYQYLPTGDGAFDTLGLQNVEGAVGEYIEEQAISGAQKVFVKLFGSRIQTGILEEVSGVIQQPLYEDIIEGKVFVNSGVEMSAESELFKKDYIYYLGERL
tara:strand:+ start:22534 stop:23928 length:1395 start_codon:yes stop_codon:yes gene_type:complete